MSSPSIPVASLFSLYPFHSSPRSTMHLYFILSVSYQPTQLTFLRSSFPSSMFHLSLSISEFSTVTLLLSSERSHLYTIPIPPFPIPVSPNQTPLPQHSSYTIPFLPSSVFFSPYHLPSTLHIPALLPQCPVRSHRSSSPADRSPSGTDSCEKCRCYIDGLCFCTTFHRL